jgi:hypothetical protein
VEPPKVEPPKVVTVKTPQATTPATTPPTVVRPKVVTETPVQKPPPSVTPTVPRGTRLKVGLKAGAKGGLQMLAFMGLDYLVRRLQEKEVQENIDRCRVGQQKSAERLKAEHPDEPIYFTVEVVDEEWSNFVPLLGWMPEPPKVHLVMCGSPTTEVVDPPVVEVRDYRLRVWRPGMTTTVTYSELMIP